MLNTRFKLNDWATIVHVNMPFIRDNNGKDPGETRLPVVTIKERGKRTKYAHNIRIHGSSEVRYLHPQDKLSCGAQLLIVTNSPFTLYDDQGNETPGWEYLDLRETLPGRLKDLPFEQAASACPVA